jgi:hypothetical protein
VIEWPNLSHWRIFSVCGFILQFYVQRDA